MIRKALLGGVYNQKKSMHVKIVFLSAIVCSFFLHDCEIIPGYRSDHSGVLLNLQINFDTEKVRGYWKFKNTLLKDIE